MSKIQMKMETLIEDVLIVMIHVRIVIKMNALPAQKDRIYWMEDALVNALVKQWNMTMTLMVFMSVDLVKVNAPLVLTMTLNAPHV